jgi:hypothetical protein
MGPNKIALRIDRRLWQRSLVGHPIAAENTEVEEA